MSADTTTTALRNERARLRNRIRNDAARIRGIEVQLTALERPDEVPAPDAVAELPRTDAIVAVPASSGSGWSAHRARHEEAFPVDVHHPRETHLDVLRLRTVRDAAVGCGQLQHWSLNRLLTMGCETRPARRA